MIQIGPVTMHTARCSECRRAIAESSLTELALEPSVESVRSLRGSLPLAKMDPDSR
jgi:hypothetical protein